MERTAHGALLGPGARAPTPLFLPSYNTFDVNPAARAPPRLSKRDEQARIAKQITRAMESGDQVILLETMYEPACDHWIFTLDRRALMERIVRSEDASPRQLITTERLSHDLRAADARYLRTYYEVMDVLEHMHVSYYLSLEHKRLVVKPPVRGPAVAAERVLDPVFGPMFHEVYFYLLVCNRLETRRLRALERNAKRGTALASPRHAGKHKKKRVSSSSSSSSSTGDEGSESASSSSLDSDESDFADGALGLTSRSADSSSEESASEEQRPRKHHPQHNRDRDKAKDKDKKKDKDKDKGKHTRSAAGTRAAHKSKGAARSKVPVLEDPPPAPAEELAPVAAPLSPPEPAPVPGPTARRSPVFVPVTLGRNQYKFDSSLGRRSRMSLPAALEPQGHRRRASEGDAPAPEEPGTPLLARPPDQQ